MTYIEIGSKLICGLFALLLVTRIMGKKTISQLTPFDFIHSVVLGGILEESIYDETISPLELLFAISIWSVMLFLIEFFSRKYDKVRIFFKGEASILMKDGKLNLDELNRNHIEMEQLRIMLRQKGAFSLRDVKDLYLEPGGAISLKKYARTDTVTADMIDISVKDSTLNYLFIDEGKINKNILYHVGKSIAWLYEELKKEGYEDTSKILYAEWSETEGFFIKTYIENEAKTFEPSKGN
ncbi:MULTISPECIES: DUF421 domain-containing protein [Exiguobacterium]|uniref:DUF421 domain-containing protein n=1 Tax=Exiguobacterium TaxID=33986 RepID=UPI001BE825F2|nr:MULTISPECIES: DUF421 domain-containing protein [Exiguobacterium]MCT4792744.1 DUF421 domain-containing protein [Exiguobacterium artemiae]